MECLKFCRYIEGGNSGNLLDFMLLYQDGRNNRGRYNRVNVSLCLEICRYKIVPIAELLL